MQKHMPKRQTRVPHLSNSSCRRRRRSCSSDNRLHIIGGDVVDVDERRHAVSERYGSKNSNELRSGLDRYCDIVADSGSFVATVT